MPRFDRPACLAGLLLMTASVIATVALLPQRGFVRRVYVDDFGRVSACRLFVPHRDDPSGRWPVIVFLHGAGETGTDGERQTCGGLAAYIRDREQEFPFLTVFPQSAHGTWDAGSEDGARATAILDAVGREFSVDEDRVYLTGVSMGGYGAWSLAAAGPRRWAAVVPVCGWGMPESAAELATVPCWCFHGAEDQVVPVANSRETVRAIRAAGGRVRYIEYPGVGHDIGRQVYDSAELHPWLLSNARLAP